MKGCSWQRNPLRRRNHPRENETGLQISMLQISSRIPQWLISSMETSGRLDTLGISWGVLAVARSSLLVDARASADTWPNHSHSTLWGIVCGTTCSKTNPKSTCTLFCLCQPSFVVGPRCLHCMVGIPGCGICCFPTLPEQLAEKNSMEKKFLWLDIFAIVQDPGSEKQQTEVAQIEQVVRSIGQTCIVVPGHGSVGFALLPSKLSWCCLEIAYTHHLSALVTPFILPET